MRFLATLAALTLASAAHAAGNGACVGSQRIHGTFQTGPDARCFTFVADDGRVFQPFDGPSAIYREGMAGTITGVPGVALPGSCELGELLRVCDFQADGAVLVVGVVRADVPSPGCFTLQSGSREFVPLSLEEKLLVDGARVKVTGRLREDLRTRCGATALEVLGYEVLGSEGGKVGGGRGASCHADYARCVRFCREATCLVSCDVVFEECLR